jgi:D-glycero-alpha-D-manno-heptose 1-phosphate guanylyltransferase
LDAIILAGGRGTRLRSVVSRVPKPMAPVAGRPFLSHLLDHLAGHDIKRVILSVGYKREVIQAHFGPRYGGMEVVYSVENEPLGTGGAMARSLGLAAGGAALALNGDTLFAVDIGAMAALHAGCGCDITMAVRQADDAGRYGAVRTSNGRITGFAEKSSGGGGFINGGVYLLGKNLFEPGDGNRSFSFEREFLPRIIDRRKVCAFVSTGYFIDIGVPRDYRRAQEELGPQGR